MKKPSVILAAIGLGLLIAPSAASPQVVQKLWDTFKPPSFRGVKEYPPTEEEKAQAAAAASAALRPDAQRLAPTPPIPLPGPGWIAPDPENTLVVDTTKGQIIVELAPQIAPAYVERIKRLARGSFYDGRKFFRVIDDFMAQTGDPEENGNGGSALPDLKGEFSFKRNASTPFVPLPGKYGYAGFVDASPVKSQPDAQMAITADGSVQASGMFCPGTLGMARAEEPDTANSQFFFMRQTYPSLNGSYTVFGRVIVGLEVVRAIKVGEPPVEPMDAMTKVRVMADIPAPERPKILVMDTKGPEFRAYVEAWRQSQGPDADICKLAVPAVRQ